jgi:hypothetical protein
MQPITVRTLFNAAGLEPYGPVAWGKAVEEKRPGVYVIAIVAEADGSCDCIDVSYLPGVVAKRWIPSQPVIYIGRTKRALSRRIKEFYHHVHGHKSPHRGGQDVKLLKCERWVYWCRVECVAVAEQKMIEAFKATAESFPFANRVRAARVNNNQK